MAAFVERCQFVAVSAGTGTFAVATAVTGYMTPAQAGATNATVYSYAAQLTDSSGNIMAWEVGAGTYTVLGATLTRAPAFSSNANALVNFSTAPNVMLTPSSTDLTSGAIQSITRAQIPSVIVQGGTIQLTGFTAAGDLGAGALYTNANASSTSPMAIQDASGTWFRLVTVGSTNVGFWGATGNPTINDSAAIQAAIDYMSDIAGGEVFFPGVCGTVNSPVGNGAVYQCNLTLKNTVHLRGSSWWQANNPGNTPLLIAHNSALPIIITQSNGYDVSISGLNFADGGIGVLFDTMVWSKIEGCSFNGFTDQAIIIGGGFANQVIRCFADNCLTNQTRAGQDGVLYLDGSDHYVVDSEFSGLALRTAQGFSSAIYCNMSTGWIVNTVAEQADQGIYVETGTTYVRFMGVRADTNQGHGFIINGVGHQFNGCLALQNGRAAADTYSGFICLGSRCTFAGCASEVYTGNLYAYCYLDIADGTNASQKTTYISTNTYTGCIGNGWATAFKFAVDPLPSSMRLEERVFRSLGQAPTIDFVQSDFCILTGYSSPTTITNFTSGTGGNTVRLLAVDANITIANNTNIVTGTGAGLNLNAFQVYEFSLYNGVWYCHTSPILTLATANKTWYVATTGSDSNPGTSSSPFLTIQHALNVAALYDYNNQYFPTINIADGTYNSSYIVLPELVNCPGGGVIVGNTTTRTNVVVNDTGSHYCFESGDNSFWSISGMRVGGTFGGFAVPLYVHGIIVVDKIDLHGSGTGFNVGPGSGGMISMAFGDVTVSSSAMDYLINIQGQSFFTAVGGTLTFSNAITFAQAVIWVDGQSFLAGSLWSIVGATNVTCSLHTLLMTSGGVFEVFSSTTVDGAPMTRANFPGHASGTFDVQPGSSFLADAINNGTIIIGNIQPATVGTNHIHISDGAFPANLRADYGVTVSGLWNLANGVQVSGSGPSYTLNGTETHGNIWVFGEEVLGTTSALFIENLTLGGAPTYWTLNWDGLGSQQYVSGAAIGWSSNATYADGAAMDTALSRVAPVSSVPTIAIGNGTIGDASGTIKAKTKAGAPTTSDVPAGTWALIRDTTNSTTKLYYNNAGSLQSVALS